MTMSPAPSNITSPTNSTDFDYYCTGMPVGTYIWAAFSIASACVGAPASLWLLWVLIQRQRSSSSSSAGGSSNNVYMLNLTVMDLIYNIFRPPDVLNYFVWHEFQFFMVTYFFEGFNFIGRPVFMACSCVDCYMAVVHPTKYMKISRSRYRETVSTLVWVSTMAYCLLFIFVQNSLKAWQWDIPCILAISTIAFCDIVVLYTLRKPDPSGRTDVHPQKQRALQTITNSFVMTLVSYLPTLLIQMVIPIGVQEVYCQIYIPSSISSMLGSTLLPILHLRNLGILNELRVCHSI